MERQRENERDNTQRQDLRATPASNRFGSSQQRPNGVARKSRTSNQVARRLLQGRAQRRSLYLRHSPSRGLRSERAEATPPSRTPRQSTETREENLASSAPPGPYSSGLAPRPDSASRAPSASYSYQRHRSRSRGRRAVPLAPYPLFVRARKRKTVRGQAILETTITEGPHNSQNAA